MEYMSAEEVKNQEDQDYLLALSLQEEYKKELEQLKEWERDKVESGMVQLSDEELARRLQQEEDDKHQQGTFSRRKIIHSRPSAAATTTATSSDEESKNPG